MRATRVVAALLAAVLLGACSGGDEPEDAESSRSPSGTSSAPSPSGSQPADLARFYDQELDWEGCGGGFDCATLTVPLDHDDPGGGTIEVAVNRRPADEPDRRIGSLLVNPGGPGASGLDYARGAGGVVSRGVLERYDLVGFDPRGVGESTPVRCLDDRETDTFLAADGSPDTAAEERRVVELSRLFGQRCAERTGDVLAHVGTPDVARDLDILRSVLGDDRLHYVGKSYGTSIGAAYAQRFPDRVGRLVLDGVVDPTLSTAELNRGQALGFEQALAAFVGDCVRRSGCPLDGNRAAGLRRIDELLDEIDRRPLRGDPGRPVTQGLAVLGLALGLYDEQFWPALRQGLDEATEGEGATLLVLADLYSERREDGRYPSNSTAAQYAVNCLDRAETADLDQVRATADALEREAPHFGAFLAWSSLPCAYWPEQATSRPGPVSAPGAEPILVVGTTGDPATPYTWAQSLARQLESARLLSYVGDGHTAYRQGSNCVDEAVDRYLLDGRLPAEGTRCR